MRRIALDCNRLHWIAEFQTCLSIDPIEWFPVSVHSCVHKPILIGETLIAILFHYKRYPIYREAISTISEGPMFPQAFCNPKSHCNPSAIQDTRNCIPKVLEQERMGSVQSGTHSDNQARWYDCMRKPEQIVMDQGRGCPKNSLTEEVIINVIWHSVIGHNKSVKIVML